MGGYWRSRSNQFNRLPMTASTTLTETNISPEWYLHQSRLRIRRSWCICLDMAGKGSRLFPINKTKGGRPFSFEDEVSTAPFFYWILWMVFEKIKISGEGCYCLATLNAILMILAYIVLKRKQIEAVRFTHEIGLVDKFSPFPLLRAQLQDARGKLKVSLNSFFSIIGIWEYFPLLNREIPTFPCYTYSPQNAALDKEMAAIKAVIGCIKDHKIECKYTTKIDGKTNKSIQNLKEKKKNGSAGGKSSTRPASPQSQQQHTTIRIRDCKQIQQQTVFLKRPASRPLSTIWAIKLLQHLLFTIFHAVCKAVNFVPAPAWL